MPSSINNLDDFTAGLANVAGNPWHFQKVNFSGTANQYSSLWTIAGVPGAGATPATGAGAACNSATSGSIPVPTLTTGQTLRLNNFSAYSSNALALMLVDRLVATSGLDANVTTLQAVNTAALPRYTDGVGVLIGIEVYSVLGSTSRTMTINYTDTANVAQSTTVTIPVSFAANRLLIASFVPGGLGCKSVESVQISGGGTGLVGNFGITLFKIIGKLQCALNIGDAKDFTQLAFPILSNEGESQPCLALVALVGTSGTITLEGDIGFNVK